MLRYFCHVTPLIIGYITLAQNQIWRCKTTQKIIIVVKLSKVWTWKCFHRTLCLGWFLATVHDQSIMWCIKGIEWQVPCFQVFYATKLKWCNKSMTLQGISTQIVNHRPLHLVQEACLNFVISRPTNLESIRSSWCKRI